MSHAYFTLTKENTSVRTRVIWPRALLPARKVKAPPSGQTWDNLGEVRSPAPGPGRRASRSSASGPEVANEPVKQQALRKRRGTALGSKRCPAPASRPPRSDPLKAEPTPRPAEPDWLLGKGAGSRSRGAGPIEGRKYGATWHRFGGRDR